MQNFARESNNLERVQVSFTKCILLILKNTLTIELFHKKNYFSSVASWKITLLEWQNRFPHALSLIGFI